MAVLALTLHLDGDSEMKISATAYGGWVDGIKELADNPAVISGELNMIQNPETKSITPSIVLSSVVKIESFNGGFAHICLTGNMGQDPDLKYFDSGSVKAKSTLAVRRTKDATDWFSFECWGTTAEIMGKYTAKGAKVGISGTLKQETWTDRNTGEVRSKLVVAARKLDLLGSRGDGASTETSSNDMAGNTRQNTRQSPPTAKHASNPSSNSATESGFDDIPF
jgi:single-strand DNA-binding protein